MSTSTTTTLVLTGLTPPSQWYINADTTITLPTIQRYGWNYNSALTVDRNYMNLAYCIARNSYCLEGNMGTVFVRGIAIGSGHHVGPPLNLTVVAQATNTALVHRFHSECHAEANAVSACSKLVVQWASHWKVLPATSLVHPAPTATDCSPRPVSNALCVLKVHVQMIAPTVLKH